jgi:hypothetical protein
MVAFFVGFSPFFLDIRPRSYFFHLQSLLISYHKDLGPETGRIANAMMTFDPGRTWKEVE